MAAVFVEHQSVVLQSGHLGKWMPGQVLVGHTSGHEVDLDQIVTDALLLQRQPGGASVGAVSGTVQSGFGHVLSPLTVVIRFTGSLAPSPASSMNRTPGQGDYKSAACIKTIPDATRIAAKTRRTPTRSFSTKAPMNAAKMTLVSRNADTDAMGPRLMAQMTRA